MRSRITHWLGGITAALLMLTALVGIEPALAVADAGGQQGQSSADVATVSNGGWDHTTTGVAGRPFVTALSVDGVSRMTGTPSSSADDRWAGALRVVVSPFNACSLTQSPAPGQCYANPNRIGITLGYGDNNSVSTNFDYSGALSYGITENSVIDMTVNLNLLNGALGWTWLNGLPSYWSVGTDGSVRVKFKPRFMPSSQGIDNHCTTIPVSTCDTAAAASEMLQASMVMSVDNTNALFRGALFATAGAIMGSLEVPSGFNVTMPTSNSLTYGLAAPHSFAADYAGSPGGVRKGSLYGFIPDALLSSAFGVTTPSQASSLLSIARTAGSTASGTDSVTWTPWTAADNGTDGQLVAITDITFSAPHFKVTRVVPRLRKGASRTQSQVLKDAGLSLTKSQKLKLTVAKASNKICSVSGTKVKAVKKGTCTYTASVVNNRGKKVAGKTKTVKFTVV